MARLLASSRNGHKALAVLLCFWPALGQFSDEVVEDLAGRRLATADLPEGLRLKEALNQSLDLTIFPTWDLFLGFSDRHKTIQGKMTVLLLYYAETLRFVSNPQLIVSVDNFGDGNRYLQGTIQLADSSGRDAFTTSNIYVGDFSQSNFDHLCFPFDDKTVRFDISIQKPGNYIFDLRLSCPPPLLAENQTVDGKQIVTKCTFPATGPSLGFDWGSFVCQAVDTKLVQCSMTGVREWMSILKGYLWPSFTFSAMGFISFTLSVKMAMPRVGTTMLALISLTNLRNALMEMLPVSGETSWLEEYFLIAMTFMLLNLCGHAISFYLDGIGKTDLQQMINKINLFGMVSVSLVTISSRLHVRDCPHVSRAFSTVLLTLTCLLLIVVFVAITWIYRDSFRHVGQILHEFSQRNTRVVPVYKDATEEDDD
ncbi:unnamed protein product [Symbiodinium natans]|uniref:Uncharacterized protein n=1 Tax=Symbiodinium natans TaxID=878477 RepID=A0A812TBN3_9DINO|nr:unnamed protein product [Symbiodinium natans]